MDNKKFVSNSTFYLISSVITQIINLVLISIYTRNMTSSQFGQYNLVSSFQSLTSIFITLAIYCGLSRFYNEVEDKNRLKNIALTFSILWGVLCCILFGYLLNNSIAYIAFRGDPLGAYYIKYVVINSVLTCFILIYTSYYSMMYKALKVCIINVMQILLTLCFTYYFLVVAKYGILGVYKSQLISFSIVFFILFILDIKNYRFILSGKELKRMLSYGIGLAPGQISSWVLTLIDRYFIKGMINLTAVAVYSMGYKLGMAIDPLFITPFKSSFTPFKFSVYKDKDGKERIRKVFMYFNFIGWFIVLGISIFSDIAIKILSTNAYSQSFRVVAIIAFSYYLWGLGEFYALGLHIANKVLISSGIITISAVLNVLFNYLLIPRLGIYGAAGATCIAYIIANLLYYLMGRKYYDIGINLLEPYKCGCIFLSLYAIYMIFKSNVNNIAAELILNVAICVMYVVLCISFKIISLDVVKKLIQKIRIKIAASI